LSPRFVEHQKRAEVFVADGLLALAVEGILKAIVSFAEVMKPGCCSLRPREEIEHARIESEEPQPLAPESGR
jgi:hypothetical protein